MRLCRGGGFLCPCVTGNRGMESVWEIDHVLHAKQSYLNVKHPLAGYQNVQIILMWTKGCSKLKAYLNSEW
jgi:hypothetical protein